MTIHKNVMANWDNTGDHPRDVVFYSDFIQLERENNDLIREVNFLQGICKKAGISTLDGLPLPNVQDEPRR
jgi:hypothetical protein